MFVATSYRCDIVYARAAASEFQVPGSSSFKSTNGYTGQTYAGGKVWSSEGKRPLHLPQKLTTPQRGCRGYILFTGVLALAEGCLQKAFKSLASSVKRHVTANFPKTTTKKSAKITQENPIVEGNIPKTYVVVVASVVDFEYHCVQVFLGASKVELPVPRCRLLGQYLVTA